MLTLQATGGRVGLGLASQTQINFPTDGHYQLLNISIHSITVSGFYLITWWMLIISHFRTEFLGMAHQQVRAPS